MGVRVTDSEHVAIYDSVTDTAFGPIFGSEADAESFLTYLRARDLDARSLGDTMLEEHQNTWYIDTHPEAGEIPTVLQQLGIVDPEAAEHGGSE